MKVLGAILKTIGGFSLVMTGFELWREGFPRLEGPEGSSIQNVLIILAPYAIIGLVSWAVYALGDVLDKRGTPETGASTPMDSAEAVKSDAPVTVAVTGSDRQNVLFSAGKEKSDPEELIRQLGEVPLHCQLTLTDVTINFPGNLCFYDLFACQNGLVYIFYASSAAQTVQNAQSFARLERENDFGMRVEERIRKRGGNIIPRAEIKSIDLRPGLNEFRIVLDASQVIMGHAGAARSCELLTAWWKDVLEDQPDTQAVNLGFPAVARLLPWLVDGSLLVQVDNAILREIPAQTGYIEALLSHFDRLKQPEKEAALKTVRGLPESWTGVFRTHLQAAQKKAQNDLRSSVVAGFAGLLGAFFFLINFPVLNRAMDFPGLVALLAALSLTVSIPIIFINRSQVNNQAGLLSLLGQPFIEKPKNEPVPIARFCSKCGLAAQPADLYCMQCGEKLGQLSQN